MWPVFVFLKELLLRDVSYQEILNVHSWMILLCWRNYSRLRFKSAEYYIYIYIYIYIYSHRRQTVSFYQNTSGWLDTQDARSRDRNQSNFTLDYVSDHSSTKQTKLAKGILRYFFYF